MRRSFGRAAAVLLVLILLMTAVPAAYADEPGEIGNVSISDAGIITWDAYPGTETYWVGIAGGFRPTSWNSYDVNAYLDEFEGMGELVKIGTHSVEIEANDPDGKLIASWKGFVTVTKNGEVTEFTLELGEIKNASISDEGVLTWDDFPGTDHYEVAIRQGEDQWSSAVTDTTYDLQACIDDLVANGNLPSSGSADVILTAHDGDGDILAQWEKTYDYESSAVPLTGIVDNIVISEDGVMTWDAYPGTAAYGICIGTSEKTTGGTSFDLKAYVEELAAGGAISPSGSVTVGVRAYNAGNEQIAEGQTVYEYETAFVPGSIENVRVSEEGKLTWNAYPGAASYVVYAGGYYKTLTGTEYDLKSFIDELVSHEVIPQSGSVSVTVRAYGSGGYPIAEGEITYTYESSAEVTPKGTIENVKISDEGMLSWDAWPGTYKYWVGINHGYRTSRDEDPLTYDVNAYLDELESYGSLVKVGTHEIKIEADSTEGYELATWEGFVTVTKNGEGWKFELTEGGEKIRLAGQNRYDTAIEAAEHLKTKKALSKFDNIIIASGAGFPDALSASYLAVWKEAPILLVNEASLAKITDYAGKNLASGGKIYIIGGAGAVPETVDAALAGTVGAENIVRFAGKNRYETNLLVLKECDKTGGLAGKELMIASGKGFADALSASAAKRPIMLVGDALTEDQIKFIKDHKADLKPDGWTYIVGGTGAVSAGVEFTLSSADGLAMKVKRFAGSNRYETSYLIAADLFSYDLDTVVIANAKNFPDGLAGGPVGAYYSAPLLLVTDDFYDYVTEYFKYVTAKRLVIMGGTGVIADATADAIMGGE